ncbi:hypothetical protein B0H19DRAFT_1154371 [Mycena capillaripes]|nr:hypothetical protein B0H19DRAFT_1154371 [Mycena capillaripes]
MPLLIPYVLLVLRLLRDPCVLYQAALMNYGPLRKVHIFIFACRSFAHIALLNIFSAFLFYWVEVLGSRWIYLCRYR